jgi:tripartite-type tricarboxylate transporter receptor subunit TctC
MLTSEAGGGSDFVARLVAQGMGAHLGQRVVVDNRGMIAAEIAKHAAPDGYTLLLYGSPMWLAPFMRDKLPYDPVDDFKPIARVGMAYLVLVTPANARANTLADLIAEMKAKPGDVTYSSAGNGSATHLTSVLLTSMAGVTARHVPYKGAAQALTDTIGGQVQFTFAGIATASAHIKAGRVKALGVSGPKRSQSLPDVPAIAEAGLPGYELTTLVGALAPKATPVAVVRKLSGALIKLSSTPEYKAFAALQGMEADLADTDNATCDAADDHGWCPACNQRVLFVCRCLKS